jgi:hypothetical protein
MAPISVPVRQRRSRRGRRARLAFSWTAAAFLAVQLGAGIVLDQVGLPFRFAEASAVVDRLSRESSPDVIFLGSSRFLGGVAIDEIARCSGRRPETMLNAAVTAGDVIAADLILNRLLERGARPKLVVIEVSPDTLNHRTYWLRYHITRQLTWADVPRYAGDIIEIGHAGTLLLSRFVPLYYYRHQLVPPISTVVEQAKPVQVAGVGDVAPSPLTAEQLTLSRLGVSHAMTMLEDYHTGGLTAEALERLLNRCDAIGARVLLVGAPVTAACRSAYVPEIDAAYRDFLAGMMGRHGCRFVDYRDRLPDDRFVDVHHLSRLGARDFSRLLAREVSDP